MLTRGTNSHKHIQVVARQIKNHPDDDPVVSVRPNEEKFIFSVEVVRFSFPNGLIASCCCMHACIGVTVPVDGVSHA